MQKEIHKDSICKQTYAVVVMNKYKISDFRDRKTTDFSTRCMKSKDVTIIIEKENILQK